MLAEGKGSLLVLENNFIEVTLVLCGEFFFYFFFMIGDILKIEQWLKWWPDGSSSDWDDRPIWAVHYHENDHFNFIIIKTVT